MKEITSISFASGPLLVFVFKNRQWQRKNYQLLALFFCRQQDETWQRPWAFGERASCLQLV
jgi:hypothetical protein